jgi:hypothetical protein
VLLPNCSAHPVIYKSARKFDNRNIGINNSVLCFVDVKVKPEHQVDVPLIRYRYETKKREIKMTI